MQLKQKSEKHSTGTVIILIPGTRNQDECNFKLKSIADEIKGSLAQSGMFSVPLGHTYQADRLSDNGDPIVSSIDHIYLSANLEDYTQAFKLSNSSTDHVPIITKLKQTKNTNVIIV